ncbi:MAG TPA: hypothetical protein PK358_04605 [Spirochaetota bacterium]|nr:hypothetical protein [Spirochaetota bacterium]HPJ34092.1 hypothetical protein [Spirochaetota bacterium]
MAKVELTSILTKARGNMNRVVHYNRLGTQCSRAHVIPRNPDTAAQRKNRNSFAGAVKAWQLLPEDEKKEWNSKAAQLRRKGKTGKTGYNVFMSEYMKNPESRD